MHSAISYKFVIKPENQITTKFFETKKLDEGYHLKEDKTIDFLFKLALMAG